MCTSLMQPQESSTLDLQEAIARKLKKFGRLEAMPEETRNLVSAAIAELRLRAKEEQLD